MFRKSKVLFLGVVTAITLLLIGLAIELDHKKLDEKPKELKTSKEDKYFQEVLSSVKDIGLPEAIPEITKNRKQVMFVADISCEMRRIGLSDSKIKETVFSDTEVKKMNANEKRVLNVIVDRALTNYCQ